MSAIKVGTKVTITNVEKGYALKGKVSRHDILNDDRYFTVTLDGTTHSVSLIRAEWTIAPEITVEDGLYRSRGGVLFSVDGGVVRHLSNFYVGSKVEVGGFEVGDVKRYIAAGTVTRLLPKGGVS